MALEQVSPVSRRLRRTQAARTLDPSEKGAINYFLGLSIAKLFADQLLHAPWLLHLDVFRPLLNPVLTGRSRPDLVGRHFDGQWVALECKGRVTPPDATAKTKAKQQAQRLITVNGVAPAFAIGAITYFRGDSLRFFWRDPAASLVKKPIEVDCSPASWRNHYAPALDLIRSRPRVFAAMLQKEVMLRVDETDLEIGIHPRVIGALLDSSGKDVRRAARRLKGHDRYRADGIAVSAGKSWSTAFMESFGEGSSL